jgi:small subunit ribosomal protein S6
VAEAVKAESPLRQYEVIYILRPDVTKETAEKVASRVTDVVARDGGQLTLVENWGRRLLAYEIQGHKRGVYVYMTYLGHGALVAELERNFRMLDEVIRFQTVKIADEVGDVQVDAVAIKFVALDPNAVEEEEDLTLEQQLGLVDAPRALRPRDDLDDVYDADDDGEDE